MLSANIKRFIRKSTFLFFTFISVLIISVTAIDYAFLSFRAQEIERTVYRNGVADFHVAFDEDMAFFDVSEAVRELKASVPVRLNQSYAALSCDADVRVYFFGQNQKLLYGKEPSNPDDIIISHGMYTTDGVRVGDVVLLNNNKYSVSGVRLFDYCELPSDALLPETKIKALTVITESIPTAKDTETVTRGLQELFPYANVTPPVRRNLFAEYALDTKTTLVFILFALAMVNISYLFKVVIDRRRLYYAIALCCGASFHKIKLQLLFESMIYSLFSVITGTTLFHVFLLNLLFPDNRFSVFDHIYAIVCCFILTTIPVLYAAVSFSGKTIKQLILKG